MSEMKGEQDQSHRSIDIPSSKLRDRSYQGVLPAQACALLLLLKEHVWSKRVASISFKAHGGGKASWVEEAAPLTYSHGTRSILAVCRCFPVCLTRGVGRKEIEVGLER